MASPYPRIYSITVHGGHGEAVQLYVVDACISHPSSDSYLVRLCVVNANELERLKKRFMKLDRYVRHTIPECPLPSRTTRSFLRSDGSGSIDRNEFLQIPQIANNPLASRMIAIFDEECAYIHRDCLRVALAHGIWLVVVVVPSTFRNSSAV
jgi:hypothetical protein